ncbi:MAG TPA: hypothetical protein VGH55_07315 [Chthoniobacterales bacterium]
MTSVQRFGSDIKTQLLHIQGPIREATAGVTIENYLNEEVRATLV